MLRDYLLRSEKTFNFHVKSTHEITDDMMDTIEKSVFKYRPVSVGSPTKTMFHTFPLSIGGKKCGEMWLFDMELSVPVAVSVLQLEMREALGFGKTDDGFRVFSEGDPREADNNELVCPDEEQEEIEKRGSLLKNENYEEVEEAKFEDYYGDAYNTNFKAYLKEFEKKRKEDKRAGPVDASHPIVANGDIPDLGHDLQPEQKDKK